MNKHVLINWAVKTLFGILLIGNSYAGIPVWTFAPVAGYSSSITINSTETATVKYTVTYHSRRVRRLEMQPIQGISASGCTAPMGLNHSCTLTLVVNGSALAGDVLGGPALCEQGNRNQCYQPDQTYRLNIRLVQPPPAQQYTITPSAGTNGSMYPSTVQTVTGGSTLTFAAVPNPGYGVNQWLVDGNVVQTGGTTYQLANITANHTVSVTFVAGALSASVSTLALSVNCPSSSTSSDCAQKNNALSGLARQITIRNTGTTDAFDVRVSSSGLPAGTSVSPASCGTITANGGTCVLTVTPGPVASSNSSNVPCTSGTEPLGSVSVTTNGGLSATVNTYVLGYGCIYQGGFVYAVDDTTLSSGSIGGKVVSLIDQADPSYGFAPQATSIIWSSNGAGSAPADVSNIAIFGIDDFSTTVAPSPTAIGGYPAYPPGTPEFVACNGTTNGACNTGNIISYYNANRTSGGIAPTPLTYYAAGLCKAVINNFNDWYLPAIAELGNGTMNQNMVTNLAFLIGDPNSGTPSTSCNPPAGTTCLAGDYWSSTEDNGLPETQAWLEVFRDAGSYPYSAAYKDYQVGVRCSRALVY